MNGSFDFVSTEDKPALLAFSTPEWLDAAKAALRELGYKIHTAATHSDFLALFAYLPWGVLQQYMLNGYFLNRFDRALPPSASAWLTAVLFGAVHTPNWFLMAVGLVGGWCATQVYRRHRNLYFLGIAHATIGFLLFVTVPDSVSHHLNIGPGQLHRLPAHHAIQ
jgi:hypothetical protein